mmetsp:Transcript_4614/g.9710  ORF Transcript_4614/g.9710 Transcript_4614/m.9710 type:complete len:972 (-) Transcript_4614:39-2954(-)
MIILEFAPFGNPNGDCSGDLSNEDKEGAGSSSSIKITTDLSSSSNTIGKALDIDPVLGLLCVDHSSDGGGIGSGGARKRRQRKERRRTYEGGEDVEETLPWMCLYTATAAFLIRIGFHYDDEDDLNSHGNGVEIDGKIQHVVEPFERQLLVALQGAPATANTCYHCGSMAMLMRHGGSPGDHDDDGGLFSHWSMSLYHGLPEALLSDTSGRHRKTHSSPNGIDVGGRINPTTEGAVTTPLRFHHEDLARGMEDTINAENEAYRSSIDPRRETILSPDRPARGTAARTAVADFCFLSPTHSPSAFASGASGAFAATSALILGTDGSVRVASPVLFDGTILPRTMLVEALARLDAEIESSAEMMRSAPPKSEREGMEARVRQCRAAKRYLVDAFGFPEEAERTSSWSQGSYYVSASVVHPRAVNGVGAVSWQPRLQGPVVMAPSSGRDGGEDEAVGSGSGCPYACIESFGGKAGDGIVEGFVVARVSSPSNDRSTSSTSSSTESIHVKFGIIPGEGAVILPRFEFENDHDCRIIDELVRGTGFYVERALVMEEERQNDDDAEGEGGGATGRALAPVSKHSQMRRCSITVDPTDDIMVHVSTKFRVVTLTTTAIAVASQCCRAQVEEPTGRGSVDMSSIRTKVWSSLEVNSNDAVLVGAGVSGDVHLGHILLARLSNGTIEAVNVTATQCLYEASEQINAKSEELLISDGNDEALQALSKVQPLHEILQPLADRVCDGLSKMGKIVGGATQPKDAGPESLAIFIETQRSCDVNVIMPIEEMSRVLNARRQLLVEMHEHQAAELERLTKLLNEWKEKYESHVKRVVELEKNASTLATRSSAVLTAARGLRPQITNAEADYFNELRRCETNCTKWESTLNELSKKSVSQCESMTAGGMENGDVRCLVNLSPEKIAMCHQLLQGEGKMLKQLEEKLKKSSISVKELSTAISGIHSIDTDRLRLLDSGKENFCRGNMN